MSDLLYQPSLHMPERADIWMPSTLGFRVQVPEAPRPANLARRIWAGKHCRNFKKAYFPHYDDSRSKFNPEWLDLLDGLIRSKGFLQQAGAAKRGIGKTEDSVIAMLYAKFYHLRHYTPWIARKIEYAYDCVEREAWQLQNNDYLRADFPEYCEPFIGCDVRQVKAPLAMTKGELTLPGGMTSRAFSIGGALRGLTLPDGTRPDFINLVDVIETLEGSEVETEGLITFIEGVAGLCESGGNMVTLMQVTVPSVGGVADTYTDPTKKPGWNGKRWRTLLSPPTDTESWTRFVEMCHIIRGSEEDLQLTREAAETPLDVPGLIGMPRDEWNGINVVGKRHALYFFASRYEQMRAGAEMIDPIRSPLHDYYCALALQGEKFVAGEYDQHPVEQEHQIVTQTKIENLLTRCIGPEKKTVPEWAIVLLASVDLGIVKGLHWEVNAFGPKGQSCLIDYGIQAGALARMGFTMAGDGERKGMLQAALIEELEAIRGIVFEGYGKPSTGESMKPALIGADVGGTDKNYAWQPLIVSYCYRAANVARWRPMKGLEWKPTMIATAQKNGIANGQWYRQDDEKGGLYLRNADYWKSQVFESHTLAPLDANGGVMPGARIFCKVSPDQVTGQRRYLHHQCNEEFHDRLPDDTETKLKVGWNQLNGKPSDWFDTASMSRNLFEIWKHERRSVKPRMVIPAGDDRGRESGRGYS